MRRKVFAVDVRCPACGASPGVRCQRLDVPGAWAVQAHDPRRRIAADEQVQVNPEHVRGQLPLIPINGLRA